MTVFLLHKYRMSLKYNFSLSIAAIARLHWYQCCVALPRQNWLMPAWGHEYLELRAPAGKRPRVYFVGRSSSLKRVIWNVKLKPGSWTLQKLNQWLVRLAELTSPHCVRAMRLIQWKIRFNFRYSKGWGEQRCKDNKNKTKTIRRIRSKLPFILKNNSDKVFRAQYCSFNPSLDHWPSLIMNVFCCDKTDWQGDSYLTPSIYSLKGLKKDEHSYKFWCSQGYCTAKIEISILNIYCIF